MVDILISLKKKVTLEHILGDGPLLDMGMSTSEIESIKNELPGTREASFPYHLGEFKAQIIDGDELWYYEWIRDSFWGTGGYAIVRGGAVVDNITIWKS
jgi:hypothetical protein